jgi:hypothetical protein
MDPQKKVKQSFLLLVIVSLVILTGCEAFVRKFARKPKKDDQVRQEIVLVPQEYNISQIPREDLYRQYFLFWRSWHDELINSLTYSSSQKKKLDCLDEAIKNLVSMKFLLKQEKQIKLDGYIAQLNALRDSIAKDVYGSNLTVTRNSAERIRMSIQKDFVYHHIKGFLT